MSIRLNRCRYSDSTGNSPRTTTKQIQYGSKEDVGFSRLFRFFRQAFPLAFNRQTFERAYDASDISRTAFRPKFCCRMKIYAALLATSTFDQNQKRQLKILMLVEDERSPTSCHIGKHLLSQLIETSRDLENIQLIYAFVESTNTDGIQFYKLMGFQEREHFENYFPRRASLTPNAIKLEYRISHPSSYEIDPISMQNTVKTK
jgi:ribosomal protein S18 acetylase RimI-like enzyme